MTSNPLFLSRARLRTGRGEALASIAPLLLPRDEKKRHAALHRIVWLLFQARPDAGNRPNWRETDEGFLWRDDGDSKLMILSRARPTDPQGLFDLETKPFAPDLDSGDRLRFSLRANPVAARKGLLSVEQRAARQRGRRVDVVMDALFRVPITDWEGKTGRAFERDRLVSETITDWLAEQGARAGFKLATRAKISANNYTQVEVERGARGLRRPAGFSIVDIEGEIEVTEPSAFLSRLPLGFGSAKAFGCGLMLIRRAPPVCLEGGDDGD